LFNFVVAGTFVVFATFVLDVGVIEFFIVVLVNVCYALIQTFLVHM
jgi:hypothetical protein